MILSFNSYCSGVTSAAAIYYKITKEDDKADIKTLYSAINYCYLSR
jgi:hypothetical protein